jgi:metal-responsive CopG/Arc/MetJ family transcriptional regulator
MELTSEIWAGLNKSLYRHLQEIAHRKGERLSTVLREAWREYIARHRDEIPQDARPQVYFRSPVTPLSSGYLIH